VGNYVQPGQSLFALITPDLWVTANFKESDLAHLRPGQTVDISVDAHPALRLKGHVDSVQLGTDARFTAFPPENATGNFVKTVQRVPVKIVIDSGLDPGVRLPLGLSVVPSVHVQ
jgi:membrane fusion protein (multidrug efflux system)